VVGINSDISTTFAKGLHRPLMPAVQRARIIASMASVDYVVIYDEPTPEETIRALGPVEILVKGDEYRGQTVPGADMVEEVRFAPTVFVEHAKDWIEKAKSLVANA
jgi:D-beta-D-heptose 7-phosphate kinase/D-beta-D-heptose 1-phosphate adenosyltransferase